MKKFTLAIVLFLLAIAQTAFAKEGNLNIVFIPKSSDQLFWSFMRDGVDNFVRETGGITLTWRGPSHNDDVAAQIEILKKYTTAGVDAIIIAPTDRTRLVEPIKSAIALGIKVVVVDSAVSGDSYQNFVTTDNYASGRLAATRLAALVNGQGRVMVFRTIAESASTEDRARGFIDYMKGKAPNITIVADEYGGASKGVTTRSAVELLKKMPDLNGVFAVNETSSEGMLRALRLNGLAGKLVFVGFDATDYLLDGLEKQEVQSLVVQDPRSMGYLAMKAAVAALRNTPLPGKTIYTDAFVVTRENYQKPEVQKLLHP